jgi:pyruvate dehydrogenase E1 component alpha subunit
MSASCGARKQVRLTFFGGRRREQSARFHERSTGRPSYKAPIVFICENNPPYTRRVTPMRHTCAEHVADAAAAYAIPGVSVDGPGRGRRVRPRPPRRSRGARRRGTDAHRGQDLPLPRPPRRDPAKYRPPGELDALEGARDPIDILGARLAEDGSFSADEQARAREEIQTHIDAAAARAAESPFPQLEETRRYVYAGSTLASRRGPVMRVRRVSSRRGGALTYREAINAALRDEMDDDATVLLIGEDVGEPGGRSRRRGPP